MNESQRDISISLPRAEIVKIVDTPGGPSSLELRVKIEGQDHNIWLSLDALSKTALSDQVVATELRAIREAVEMIQRDVSHHAQLQDLIESVRPLLQKR